MERTTVVQQQDAIIIESDGGVIVFSQEDNIECTSNRIYLQAEHLDHFIATLRSRYAELAGDE